MKLYITRHGESETNKKGCWTGWLDAQLTDKGLADAELARETLRGIKFDKVYSSDLIRAKRRGCRI
ncbi:MAG: histidine phosphatase family protein [Clostridia bacterium]|nr:histidine phosphatase family protein [Clostridia bacterium]